MHVVTAKDTTTIFQAQTGKVVITESNPVITRIHLNLKTFTDKTKQSKTKKKTKQINASYMCRRTCADAGISARSVRKWTGDHFKHRYSSMNR